jgi:DNA-binding MarR family transcriptional regulator
MSQEPKLIKRRSIDLNIKAAWLSITKMYNVLGQQYSITHSNGFVLLNIDAENGIPATKIAPLMGMEAGSLTRMLKTLEDDGWIIRKTDEIDKRKVIVQLTEEGKRRRELARLAVKEFNRRVREAVPPEKMEVFLEVIQTAYAIAEEIKDHAYEEIAEKVGKEVIV